MLQFFFAESTRQHLLHTWTGNKALSKFAHHHSGFPGGLTSTVYGELLEKHPTRAVEKAIKGMLPKNRLGREMAGKLKVYAGPEHPHLRTV
ncbi:MAG: hypothetical protein RLZZ73_984 [Actinomycetota bacterium]